MQVRVDEQFAREVDRHDLRFTCADCFHFLPEEGACAHEWPNRDHLAAPPRAGGLVTFCKEFELR